eukprot:4367622-Prymnesium_polylepis.1
MSACVKTARVNQNGSSRTADDAGDAGPILDLPGASSRAGRGQHAAGARDSDAALEAPRAAALRVVEAF